MPQTLPTRDQLATFPPAIADMLINATAGMLHGTLALPITFATANNAVIPVDADAIAQQADLPTLPNKTKQPRRMIPILPVKLTIPPETIGLPEAPEPDPALAAPANGAAPTPNATTPKEQDDDAADSPDA